MINRRSLLLGTAVLTSSVLSRRAFADEPPVPIIFVHGDSDQAAIWQTVFWRFESNGCPLDRLFAINFANPQARDDDGVAQPNRSSTQDELRELADFVDAVRKRTGADKVALVALSRGGYSSRSYIASAGAAHVSRAVLCGTPNHGVFAIDALIGSEYNGRGPFLSKLNGGGATETTPGVPFLTLRSDGYDLYAQPDGVYIGHAGMPTNVNSEGPALKGATNLVLGRVDHRETATSPLAFAAIYEFLIGRAPSRIAILPESAVVLDGRVTGVAGATPTNLPVEGAKVDVFAVDADTGERKGAALVSKTTGADGVWGPLNIDGVTALEFVVAVQGAPVTHIYRSPFARSFGLLDLRPSAPLAAEDADAGAVVMMNRPRGYFGLPRDVIFLDGRQPTDIPPGVPAVWHTKLKLPSAEPRPIIAEFNLERIVARPWPVKENHVAITELTY
ncbi:MAG TPA: hydrolase [Roseiarcus sp.]|jgi:pimeloyl-ACP methyl ester carboxylesterase